MEGNLKQQCVDQTGLYVWLRKHVAVTNSTGMLHITDLDGSDTSFSISLRAVNTAKEWSFASALSGYGFDLICSSGKLLTFLVDDDNLSTCQQWTSTLNKAIKDASSVTEQEYLAVDDKENVFRQSFVASGGDGIADIRMRSTNTSQEHIKMPINIGSSADFQDFYEKNVVDSHQERQHFHPLKQNASRYEQQSSSSSNTPMQRYSHSDLRGPVNSSRGEGAAYNSMPEMNATQILHGGNYDMVNVEGAGSGSASRQSHVQEQSQRNVGIGMSNLPAALDSSRNNDNINNPSQPSELNPNRASAAIIDLNARCRSLEEQLHESEQEVGIQRINLYRMKEELQVKSVKLLKFENEAWEKEKTAVAVVREEAEFRLIRAVNENKSFFEATSAAAAAQHAAELDCLREELSAERKRHSGAFERETTWRSRLEHEEGEARNELHAVRDRLNNLQISQKGERDELEAEIAALKRDLKRVQAETQRKVEALQNQLDEVQAHSCEEVQQRVQELNEKFAKSIETMREMESKALRQELEGEKLRVVSETQKSCQQEIERIRTDERRLAHVETEKVRAAFLRREQLTTEDLIQLELLHAARILELEGHIDHLKRQRVAAEEQHREHITAAQSQTVQAKVRCEAAETKERTFALQAAELKAHCDNMGAELQQQHAKEQMYRTQLSKALEDNSVVRAEALAIRSNVTALHNEIYQWKKSAESSIQQRSVATQQNEAAQKELVNALSQVRRLKTETENLRREVEHADKLIYGVPQHRVDDRTNCGSTVSEHVAYVWTDAAAAPSSASGAPASISSSRRQNQQQQECDWNKGGLVSSSSDYGAAVLQSLSSDRYQHSHLQYTQQQQAAHHQQSNSQPDYQPYRAAAFAVVSPENAAMNHENSSSSKTRSRSSSISSFAGRHTMDVSAITDVTAKSKQTKIIGDHSNSRSSSNIKSGIAGSGHKLNRSTTSTSKSSRKNSSNLSTTPSRPYTAPYKSIHKQNASAAFDRTSVL